MSVKNRARRAAKRRAREQAAQRSRSASAEAPSNAGLSRQLSEGISTAVRRGWTPADLVEITRRRLSTAHIPLVAALVGEETDRHPSSTVATGWRDELQAMGPGAWPDLATAEGAHLARGVALMLQQLPPIAEVLPPPGAPPRKATSPGSPAPSGALAKVRALLAKAESTEFPDEAEALSAKAQQLIATYALDRYAAQLDAAGPEVGPGMAVRRVWIDAPYVDAKSMLVDAVADANHCRSVLSKYLGFVTLVGHASDVEATELLVTSLQVQADRAMLRQGRFENSRGQSRTRSFRQSFLVSYAGRIGERLRQTTEDTLAASTRSAQLVPVMARNDEQVRKATEELFPHITMRRTRISNYQGWVAGRAAADLATLDVRGQVANQAAS